MERREKLVDRDGYRVVLVVLNGGGVRFFQTRISTAENMEELFGFLDGAVGVGAYSAAYVFTGAPVKSWLV